MRAFAPEPLLDTSDIQGNILAGFNKDQQLLVALNITDLPAARRWLARVVPYVSSLEQVFRFNALFRATRHSLGGEPVGLVASWCNIAFSHAALAKLTSTEEADALPDAAFIAGLKREKSEFLGDPIPNGETDPTASWVVGGTNRIPDVFMILASDHKVQLGELSEKVLPNPAADGVGAPQVVWQELGETRRDLPGHEHFGFRDGVSQPGVRGMVSKRPPVFLTPRSVASGAADEVNYSRPGQPLVWPGNFVLGYPFTDRNDGTPQGPSPLAHPWFRNGSFLVFRRLNQNVAGFSQFLVRKAAELALLPNFAGITPEHLGAILVGRWPSGAPLSRAPRQDDPQLARDAEANNDFVFGQDTPPPNFLPGHSAGSFSPAMEGSHGPVCPHAAHIFKVNPRDVATDVGPDFDTLTRRILRRGSPFGPPLANPLQDDEVERGLHFLCYQASIQDQFEFLQQNWANSAVAPKAGGHDVIIGQTPDKTRTIELPAITPDGQPTSVTAPTQWVTPTGGGYFFAPSLSAIRKRLAQLSSPTGRRRKRLINPGSVRRGD